MTDIHYIALLDEQGDTIHTVPLGYSFHLPEPVVVHVKKVNVEVEYNFSTNGAKKHAKR